MAVLPIVDRFGDETILFGNRPVTSDGVKRDTIVALSSGALPSGIAVLRISGPLARDAVERLAGSLPPGREARLRRIRDHEGGTIDRGMVLFFAGPPTVTGEDLGEIHLHGGRAVVAACLAALTALPGLRLAEAGEFTRRAFENGRIDLTEAEGLADLLSAETEAQRIRALRDAGGALRGLYEDWMARLVRARALLDASFDFADEGDVGDDVTATVEPLLRALAADMRAHLGDARRGEILRHGYRVVIAGAPNAGKSSLLNALADREAAIVSAIPGTTRDLIELSLDLGGLPVRLIDTAGLRETTDPVEAIGVARAAGAVQEADLVLWLAEGGEGHSQDALIHVKQDLGETRADDLARADSGEGPARLRIRTKSDLGGVPAKRFGPETFDLSISVRTGAGLSDLINRIASSARLAAGDPNALVPTRVRHREIVADALALLEDASRETGAAEFRAETLRRAGDRLGALTGRTGVEDVLDVIFSEFCIGK